MDPTNNQNPTPTPTPNPTTPGTTPDPTMGTTNPATAPYISTDTPIIDPLAPGPVPTSAPIAEPVAPNPAPAEAPTAPTPVDLVAALKEVSAQTAPTAPAPASTFTTPTEPVPPLSTEPVPSAPIEPAMSAPASTFTTPTEPVPLTPVEPVSPTPIIPESPVAQTAPIAPELPVTPEPSITLEPSAAQANPVAPEAPVVPPVAAATEPVPTADSAAPAPAAPALVKTPKFKLNRTAIIIIALAAVLLIGGVILVIALTSGNKQANQDVNSESIAEVTPAPESVGPVTSALKCTLAISDETLLENLGRPSLYQSEVEISFVDNSLSVITQSYSAQYDSPELADQGLATMQSQYDTYVRDNLGIAVDPLSSSYTVANNAAISRHSVQRESFSLGAARVLGFNTEGITSTSELNLSQESLKNAYSAQGFSCQNL